MAEFEGSLEFPDEFTEESLILWNKKLQILLSSIVIEEDIVSSNFSRICGVDVAYRDDQNKTIWAASAVITDDMGHELASKTTVNSSPPRKYIPGHFSLRELPCILEILPKIGPFDLLLLDCHGRIHPRRFGMACHAGICAAKPTIGVAKSLLCGKILPTPLSDHFNDVQILAYPVSLEGEIVGAQIPISQNKARKKSRSFYVSVGNLISLPTAVSIASRLIQGRNIIPLKLAHERSTMALSMHKSP
ncbi:MAG: endonuclease V [Candidatus Thorarchaeota archaeon]